MAEYGDAAGSIGGLLVVIGALAWGLYGVTGLAGMEQFLLVDALTLGNATVANILYTLVGVAAVPAAWQMVKGLGN